MKKHIICAVLGVSATVAHAQAAKKPVFTCQSDRFVGKVYAGAEKGTFIYKQWYVDKKGRAIGEDEEPEFVLTGGEKKWNAANDPQCAAAPYVFLHSSGHTALILKSDKQQGCFSTSFSYPKHGSLEVMLLKSKIKMSEIKWTPSVQLAGDKHMMFYCKAPK